MSSFAPSKRGNRLAQLVNRPGGMTATEAERAADANLATIRGDTVSHIDLLVRDILAAGARLRAGPDEAAASELYALANKVGGMAGIFGLHGVGEVCFSVCDLVDRLRVLESWNGPAIGVHMDSLRLVRSGEMDADQGYAAVVAALRRVVGSL